MSSVGAPYSYNCRAQSLNLHPPNTFQLKSGKGFTFMQYLAYMTLIFAAHTPSIEVQQNQAKGPLTIATCILTGS